MVDLGRAGALADPFKSLGLVEDPKRPASGLSNPAARKQWIEEKQRFYRFKDPQLPSFSLDLFLESPISLGELKKDAVTVTCGKDKIVVCSIAALRKLKQLANRPQDKLDLQALEVIEAIEARRPINNPPPGFDQAMIQDLKDFSERSAEERLEWLKLMLTELGQFCILG